MDKRIRDMIIVDAVKNCNHILLDTQEEFAHMYSDGKLFFKGCVEGFELSKKLVCLEQFEQFIISLRTKEERYKHSTGALSGLTKDDLDVLNGMSKAEYITNLGKRCALEFIYTNLSSLSAPQEQPKQEDDEDPSNE